MFNVQYSMFDPIVFNDRQCSKFDAPRPSCFQFSQIEILVGPLHDLGFGLTGGCRCFLPSG